MKHILIATDFSRAARNACLYGVQLARAFNARVTLFSVFHQMPVLVDLEDARRLSEDQLGEEVMHLKTEYNLQIDTDCKEGPNAEMIVQYAKEKKADLIIAGMKEAAKGFGKVFGSTVINLSRISDIPILIIPENNRYEDIKTIALANDKDLDPSQDPHLMDSLREVVERFHCKLYLVRVAHDRFKEAFEMLNSPFQLKRILKNLDPLYEPIEGKHIPAALNSFIDEYNVDILAILPHKHSLMERLFYKSTTRAMIYESSKPIMILPPKEKEVKQPTAKHESAGY